MRSKHLVCLSFLCWQFFEGTREHILCIFSALASCLECLHILITSSQVTAIFFHWRISFEEHIFCYWHFLRTSIFRALYFLKWWWFFGWLYYSLFFLFSEWPLAIKEDVRKCATKVGLFYRVTTLSYQTTVWPIWIKVSEEVRGLKFQKI